MLYNLSVGQLVVAVVTIVMTILLLVAAVKNRMPNLMLPWIVVQIVSILIAISYLIYLAIMGITTDDTGVVEILIACVGGGMYTVCRHIVAADEDETRSNSPHVQLGSLSALSALVEKLGEDYLALLPEAIPFLAELLEDDVNEVEVAAQTTIANMENMLGEPLQKYF
jgi:hypothetical protein